MSIVISERITDWPSLFLRSFVMFQLPQTKEREERVVKPKQENTLGSLRSFILASSNVFWPFFELHFEHAVT